MALKDPSTLGVIFDWDGVIIDSSPFDKNYTVAYQDSTHTLGNRFARRAR